MSKRKVSQDLPDFSMRWQAIIHRFGGEEQLAERAGISKQTVHKWLVGVSRPDVVLLAQVSKNLGLSADYILGISSGISYTSNELVRIITEYTGLDNHTIDCLHQTKEPTPNTGNDEEYLIAENRNHLARDFINRMYNNFELLRLASLVQRAMVGPENEMQEEKISRLLDSLGKELGGYFPSYYDLFLTQIRTEVSDIIQRQASQYAFDKFMNQEENKYGKH